MAIAAIIDVMSIQKYIYSSNKLKENIGASLIISGLFKEKIREPYCKYFESALEKKGYEGGGNALLIFEDIDKQNVINTLREFTLHVLLNYPGIDLGIGIDYDFDGFNLDNVYSQLQISKNRFIPISAIPSHGITAECIRTGLSAEIFYESNKQSSYISYSSYAKLKKIDDIKSGKYFDVMQKILSDSGLHEKYCFTDELENLGSKKGEDSHIAFVAIDGNSMSDRFMACNSLDEKKQLSNDLRTAVEKSFIKLLEIINDEFDFINEELDIKSEKGKKVLPIRPIVLGGDDVSFICEGSMGVYFAYKYLKFFEAQKVSDGKQLSACAGVAIAHAKYPIYRIQKIAEELLSGAKDKRKKDKDIKGDSYIDFQMFYGGIFGELGDIRKSHYENVYGKMYMRPYKEEDLENLMSPLRKMKRLSESKIKEIRTVLNKTKSERSNFIEHMKMRSNPSPNENENSNSGSKSFSIPSQILGQKYDNDFYLNNETPYFDMIELLEILPDYVIERGSLNG